MRKTLIAVTALVLLGAYQVPAQAAPPDAPADVQISWADVAKKTVKLTWKDSGEKNYFDYEIDGADAGDDGAESAQAVSPWFDTARPAVPSLTDATPLADGSLRLNWSLAAVPADTTPNDPLDLGPASETVGPGIWPQGGSPKAERFPRPAGSTTGVVPPRPRPFPVRVYAQNEWAQVSSKQSVTFAVMALSIKVPAVADFGRLMYPGGTAGAQNCLTVSPTCGLDTGAGIVVTMQRRADATKPWNYAGRYLEQGDGIEAYTAPTGGQQYRYYLPTWKYFFQNDWTVTSPVSTTARYSATQAHFVVAGFNTLTAQVGQILRTTVEVRPAGAVKASLQWYDGKVWHHAAYIPLTKGKGTLNVKAAGRGTTRYWRVAVPKMTYNGLPIVTTGSRAFKLTVR